MANNKLFDDNALKAMKAAYRKKWALIGIVVVVFIAIVSFLIFHEMKDKRNLYIAQKYAEIDEIYNQESLSYQQQLDAQKANSQKQNLENMAKLEPNYSTSMSKFHDFVLQYPNNAYAWQAAVRASTYFISKNKLAEAQKELETVLPYISSSVLLQIKIRTSLAGIYADQNKIPQAIEQLTIVENLPHNPSPNQSRLLKAQILLSANNNAEAKNVLNKIISSQNEDGISFSSTDDLVHQAKILLNKIGLEK